MVATLLERFNVIAGGDKMAQQLAPGNRNGSGRWDGVRRR
jgi:hypothetical protein